tara:strand:- start:1530 stop:1640 length:111 start_codon:yes stop_codon:yes gene_type:complete
VIVSVDKNVALELEDCLKTDPPARSSTSKLEIIYAF